MPASVCVAQGRSELAEHAAAASTGPPPCQAPPGGGGVHGARSLGLTSGNARAGAQAQPPCPLLPATTAAALPRRMFAMRTPCSRCALLTRAGPQCDNVPSPYSPVVWCTREKKASTSSSSSSGHTLRPERRTAGAAGDGLSGPSAARRARQVSAPPQLCWQRAGAAPAQTVHGCSSPACARLGLAPQASLQGPPRPGGSAPTCCPAPVPWSAAGGRRRPCGATCGRQRGWAQARAVHSLGRGAINYRTCHAHAHTRGTGHRRRRPAALPGRGCWSGACAAPTSGGTSSQSGSSSGAASVGAPLRGSGTAERWGAWVWAHRGSAAWGTLIGAGAGCPGQLDDPKAQKNMQGRRRLLEPAYSSKRACWRARVPPAGAYPPRVLPPCAAATASL